MLGVIPFRGEPSVVLSVCVSSEVLCEVNQICMFVLGRWNRCVAQCRGINAVHVLVYDD